MEKIMAIAKPVLIGALSTLVALYIFHKYMATPCSCAGEEIENTAAANPQGAATVK